MKKILLPIVLLLIYGNAFAGTYYVSPSGSGSTCSEGLPCAVTYAMSNAVASDVWIFQDGTYNVGQQGGDYHIPVLNPTNSGSSGTGEGDGYITFKAENMLSAIINGDVKDGEVNCSVIGTAARSYIIWDGFRVTASANASGYSMATVRFDVSGGNSILRNCEIVGDTHSEGGGTNYEGLRIESVSNITITNCYVYGFIESSNNHNTSGFKSYNVSNITIEYSTFSNNTVNLYPKENSDSHTIRYNFLDTTAGGSQQIFYQTKSTGDAAGAEIHHNILNGGDWQLNVNDSAATYDLTNPNVYNNTFYNATGGAIGEEHTNNSISIWNNISITAASSDWQLSGGTDGNPVYMDYNSYWTSERFQVELYEAGAEVYESLTDADAWDESGELQGGGNPDTNSYYQNPQLSDLATADSADDFRPTNDTPATITGSGRGGSYESYMGAWDPNSPGMWIGYCASDRYPSNTGNCDVTGNADGVEIGTAGVSISYRHEDMRLEMLKSKRA